LPHFGCDHVNYYNAKSTFCQYTVNIFPMPLDNCPQNWYNSIGFLKTDDVFCGIITKREKRARTGDELSPV
jgi:hypothetical protein